jgi:hypothetical protein
MRNMVKNKPVLTCILFLLFVFQSHAGQFPIVGKSPSLMFVKAKATFTGPYFGLQRGQFGFIELGMERQWKQFKLVHPIINSAHFGINYNYKNNIMGYDLGYWRKKGRLNFTYGANLCLRTNFERYRFGFTPTIGYKIWQLHLQTGYHFLIKSTPNFDSNTFFISARFVLINDVDFKIKRKKRKK